MKTKEYKGLLSLHSFGECDAVLYLSSEREPLASVLKDNISNKQVSVRYWITNCKASVEEATADFMGWATCEFESRYSEITGYLWTDEECKIGGHNLIAELRSFVDKWLILQIDIH